MFSNVGWGEILVIFILGLILVGPERLPKVVQDVRAMLLAARTAINEARDNLSDEFSEDFDDLRKPLQDLNELRRLNPRTAITRTLFEGDDTYLDLLTGKPAAGGGAGTASANSRTGDGTEAAITNGSAQPQQSAQATPMVPQTPAQPAEAAQSIWRNPVEEARLDAQQPRHTQPTQPGQQPEQTRGVNAWVDNDNL